MRGAPSAAVALSAILALMVPSLSSAADTWLEIKSPNFVVLSNTNERRARDVAWQFEQIRAALLAGWPWARARLDRPVQVIAVKDEDTMKALAPRYWEQRGATRPTSVFVTAPDRHYIALRADIQGDGEVNVNPYFSSYWSYSALALNAAFDADLPLWFRNGLAGVLSNSMVRNNEIRFGLSVPWYHQDIVTQGRLRLTALLTTTSSSPYYTSSASRDLFDAQAWGLMHYMLFGQNDQVDRVNAVAKLLLSGTPSVAAVTEVFGSLDALEQGYIQYLRKPLFPYSRLKTETKIVAKDFTVRTVAEPDAAAGRAGFLATTGRAAEARALVAEARKAATPPVASFEAEAILLDLEGKRDDARSAFLKAEELGSANFFVHYRLATLTLPTTVDPPALAAVDKRLRRAAELNDVHVPTLTLLANVLAQEGQGAEAVTFATKAVRLEPADSQTRLSLARGLWAAARRDEASGHARAAMSLAKSDEERRQVQELLAFFTRSTPR
ncbi:MAG TPA: hypothetical protein VIY56_04215 [Vicinamibacterales bacterium]